MNTSWIEKNPASFICKGGIENDYEADGSGSFLAGTSNWNGVENSGDGTKKAIKV